MQVSKQSTRFKVIWQQATLLYYHICQVAALVTNLLVCNAFATPFWGKEGRMGLVMLLFKIVMVVSYRLSITKYDNNTIQKKL